jgi:phosphoribosylaminoimidazole carboxylase (NCAIR synthetase)
LEQRVVLVLGGGVYAFPLIQALQQLGCRVLVTSNDPTEPGFALVTDGFSISTTHLEELITLVEKYAVSAVLTTASDWNTFSQAALNDHFAFHGVNRFQVKQVSEKPTIF